MKKYTGWIINATLVFYLLSILVPFLLVIPTLLAWLVPLLLWHTLGKAGVAPLFEQTYDATVLAVL